VNAYLRRVDEQEARASAQGIDETTECGYSKAQRGVVARGMGVSRGYCNDYPKSSSKTMMELSLSTG